MLSWQGESLPVTFSPACFDVHPDTVRFLTYGNALLDEILAGIPEPEGTSHFGLVRCRTEGEPDLRGWYLLAAAEPCCLPVESFSTLLQAIKSRLDIEQPSADSLISLAGSAFAAEAQEVKTCQTEVIVRRRRAQYLALRARSQLILLRAAMVELALGQNPNYLDETYPTAFNDQAVRGLQRHGYPWGALLILAFDPGLAPSPENAYFRQIANEKRETLKGRYFQLREEARKTVVPLQAALDASKPARRTTSSRPLV